MLTSPSPQTESSGWLVAAEEDEECLLPALRSWSCCISSIVSSSLRIISVSPRSAQTCRGAGEPRPRKSSYISVASSVSATFGSPWMTIPKARRASMATGSSTPCLLLGDPPSSLSTSRRIMAAVVLLRTSPRPEDASVPAPPFLHRCPSTKRRLLKKVGAPGPSSRLSRIPPASFTSRSSVCLENTLTRQSSSQDLATTDR
mmetsp:Transcript_4590/g.16079  ORF Transcript_4590/g.16079 Transcript_4590/m.16079 type:complete len:202 (-) Transcript_4590:578-1183(-)